MSKNLHQAAWQCLVECAVPTKLAAIQQLHRDWQAGLLLAAAKDLPVVEVAGRPDKPVLVDPAKVPKRKLGSPEGQAALVHALAHIEFNAVNLACDAVYRFQGLPDDFYSDWLQVAAEEAYHFSLLQQRLAELDYAYGDFPAHNGLWEMACKTAEDPLLRMALVPRVMEARGLDVTPGMMQRFARIGDDATVDILQTILRDEIQHVEVGSRWFRYFCEQRELDPETHYLTLLQHHFQHGVRGPLHTEARLAAGFSPYELEELEALCKKPS